MLFQNWEYADWEQRLRTDARAVHTDGAFREHGEWRITNSTACEGVVPYLEDGPRCFVKVKTPQPVMGLDALTRFP